MIGVEEYQGLITKFMARDKESEQIDALQLAEELLQVNPHVSNKTIQAILSKLKSEGYQVVNDELLKASSLDPEEHESEEPANGVLSLSGLSSFQLLLKDLEQYPMLNAEEERKVAKQMTAGDNKARERLITANIRLVLTVAKRYHRPGIEIEDLVGEGFLGLIRATELFDYTKGFRFSTYATWWIRQRITRYISDKHRTIRLPLHVHEMVAKLKNQVYTLEIANGRQPTEDELAKALDWSKEQVSYFLTLIDLYDRAFPSLDSTVGEDEDSTLQELIADPNSNVEEQIVDEIVREGLNNILKLLKDRERDIIALRFGLNKGSTAKTLEEVGQTYGVTRERIRQIEKRALGRLRKLLIAKGYQKSIIT